jgi:hypothetical protein
VVSAATARPAGTSTAAPSTEAMSAKRFVAEAAAACLLLAVLLVVFG